MAYLLVTYKQILGLMNIMNITTRPPPSLIMMVSRMLITLLVVIMVQLCLVYTMLMGLSKNAIAVLLLVTVISVVCFLRMMLTLIRLSAWAQGALKGRKKFGLGSQTWSGGRGLLLKEISKTGIMNQSLSHWKDYEISIASENLIRNIRIREGTLD